MKKKKVIIIIIKCIFYPKKYIFTLKSTHMYIYFIHRNKIKSNDTDREDSTSLFFLGVREKPVCFNKTFYILRTKFLRKSIGLSFFYFFFLFHRIPTPSKIISRHPEIPVPRHVVKSTSKHVVWIFRAGKIQRRHPNALRPLRNAVAAITSE